MRWLGTVLRFVRFPLVWTALGDVLAGAAVAAGSPERLLSRQVIPLLVISPALYMFGMGINDLLDVTDDRRAGRDRPLARYELTVGRATLVVLALFGAAMAGALRVSDPSLKMVLVTAAAIAFYNCGAKLWLPSAILFMVGCRVGNVLIGWGTGAALSGIGGGWRFDLSERAPQGWVLVGAVAALTAVASLVSGLEKRGRLKRVGPWSPDRVILGCLLALPVVGAACVAWTWWPSPWWVAWLAAIPLVMASSAMVRRLRAAGRPAD